MGRTPVAVPATAKPLSNISGGIRITVNGDGFGHFDKLRAGKLTTGGSTKLTTGAIKIFRRGWERDWVPAPAGGRRHGFDQRPKGD